MRWSLVAVAAMVPGAATAQVLSPGPLSQAHASIEGDDHCARCHESGNKVVARLCLDCHKDLGGEIAAGLGLHGRQYRTRSCDECHVEHVGRGTKLIRWPSGAMERFDHALTGWALDGGHAKATCLACHTRTSPQRKPQFVATRTGCAGCHKDPHAGRFTTDCQKCHTVTAFKAFDRPRFDHKLARFPLTGKHVAVPCGSCHTRARPRLAFRVAKQACRDCHANPHGSQFDTEIAAGGCARCHTSFDWHLAKIDHLIWPLTGAHARTPCVACHGEHQNGAPATAYRGLPHECEGCHDDRHAGQFRQTAPAKTCKTCHDTESFRIAAAFDHAATGFALDGKHRELACERCHPTQTLRNGTTAVRWRLGYRRCKDCHANPHQERP